MEGPASHVLLKEAPESKFLSSPIILCVRNDPKASSETAVICHPMICRGVASRPPFAIAILCLPSFPSCMMARPAAAFLVFWQQDSCGMTLVSRTHERPATFLERSSPRSASQVPLALPAPWLVGVKSAVHGDEKLPRLCIIRKGRRFCKLRTRSHGDG